MHASPSRLTSVTLPIAILAVSALASCGKEVGRIALRGEGQGETTIQATAGKKLALWTSLDVKYKGNFAARYDVELVEGGAVVGKASCDPLDVNVKTSSRETNFNGDRSVSWQGKMRCELTPSKSGAAVVRAKLLFVQRPPALTVTDMSLVVKE